METLVTEDLVRDKDKDNIKDRDKFSQDNKEEAVGRPAPPMLTNSSSGSRFNQSASIDIRGLNSGSQDLSRQFPFDILNSFVPDLLVTHLLDTLQKDGFTEPWSNVFTGVCLIADISGFTRVSGAFCSEGSRGIDGLQQLINVYLGNLVSVVYAFGGDVINFAGDALICVFCPRSDKPEDLMAASKKSMLCAWELKDQCTEQLTLRVCVGLGEIAVAVLGGHERKWEFLQSCDHIDALSECLNSAKPKSVVVTAEMFSHLQQVADADINHGFVVEGDPCPPDRVLVTSLKNASSERIIVTHRDTPRRCQRITEAMEPDMVGLIDPFVPQPVTQALSTGTFHFMAELREATTVFVKWEGYSWAKYRDLVSLQPLVRIAQELITASGGFLRQFLVDDKGCVLIAIWGVPAATFPDNCMRALWMTASLVEQFCAYSIPMPVSCGITTGTVYCGNIGSRARMEYSCLGAVVNLAARLMSAAKMGILIDEETYYRLPEMMRDRLEKMNNLTLKGYEAEVPVYKFVGFPVNFDFRDVIFGLTVVPIRSACKQAFIPLLRNLITGPLESAVATPREHRTWLQHSVDIGCGCWPNSSLYMQLMAAVSKPHAQNESLHEITFDQTQSRTYKLVRMRSVGGSNDDIFKCRAVIVEGAVGTGKGRSVNWLKTATTHINARSVHVNLHKSDALTEFSAANKLFRQLVGEDMWDTADHQIAFIRQFLFELYPTDKDSRQKVGLPTFISCLHASPSVALLDLRHTSGRSHRSHGKHSILGVSPNIGHNQSVSMPVNPEGQGAARKEGSYSHSKSFALPSVASRVQCLFEIFQRLLSKHPTLVIFENIQFMDESSWKVLLQFPGINCKVSLLLTRLLTDKAIGNGNSGPGAPASSPAVSRKAQESLAEVLTPRREFFQAGAVACLESNVLELLTHPFTSKITLGTLSTEEIASNLAYSLNTRPNLLPSGLVTTVQQLSGSNPMWVGEMCEFIRTTGVDEFMNSMASTLSGGSKADVEDVESRTPRTFSRQGSGKMAELQRLGSNSNMSAALSRQLSNTGSALSVSVLGRQLSGLLAAEDAAAGGSGKLGSRQSSFKTSLLMSSPVGRSRTPNDLDIQPQPSLVQSHSSPSHETSADLQRPGRLPPMSFDSTHGHANRPRVNSEDGRGRRAIGTQYQSQIDIEDEVQTGREGNTTSRSMLKLDPIADDVHSAGNGGSSRGTTARSILEELVGASSSSATATANTNSNGQAAFEGDDHRMRHSESADRELNLADNSLNSIGSGRALSEGPTIVGLSSPSNIRINCTSDKGRSLDESPLEYSITDILNGPPSPQGRAPVLLEPLVRLSPTTLVAPTAVPAATASGHGHHRRDSKEGLNVAFVLPNKDLTKERRDSQNSIRALLTSGLNGTPGHSSPVGSRNSFSLNGNGTENNERRGSFSALNRELSDSKMGNILAGAGASVLSSVQRTLDSINPRSNGEKPGRLTPKNSFKGLQPQVNNKLAFLVVCRFAKLSTELQSIARTASIVGFEFTQSLLSSVLPPALVGDLQKSLEALVASNWLDPAIVLMSPEGETSAHPHFNFIHPMVHRAIYELTPPSVRDNVHLQLAQFMEKSPDEMPTKEDSLQFTAYREYLRSEFHGLKCRHILTKS
jgi:class 3 adenylate cyclase